MAGGNRGVLGASAVPLVTGVLNGESASVREPCTEAKIARVWLAVNRHAIHMYAQVKILFS